MAEALEPATPTESATSSDLPETPWLQELAHQMLKQPLPPGWSEQIGYQGSVYYFHKVTGDTSSSHPQQPLFKAILEEAMSWPSDATREEVAARCQRHLDSAHAVAAKALAEWSGPYCMEAGRRPDRRIRPGVSDFRDLYYYNEITGESSWVDPRVALQFDLQQQRQLTYLCLALYRPSTIQAPNEEARSDPAPQIQVIPPEPRTDAVKLTLPLLGRQVHTLEVTSPKRGLASVGDDSCRSQASYYSATSTCSDEVPVVI